MAQMVVIYRAPKSDAFDIYYRQTHVPLVKKIPGLTKFELSQGPVTTPGKPSGVHQIATLHFSSMGALRQGLNSAEGQATTADARKFMGENDSVLIFECRES